MESYIGVIYFCLALNNPVCDANNATRPPIIRNENYSNLLACIKSTAEYAIKEIKPKEQVTVKCSEVKSL